MDEEVVEVRHIKFRTVEAAGASPCPSCDREVLIPPGASPGNVTICFCHEVLEFVGEGFRALTVKRMVELALAKSKEPLVLANFVGDLVSMVREAMTRGQ